MLNDLSDICKRITVLEEKINVLEEELDRIYDRIKRLYLFLVLVFVLRE